MKHGEGYIVHAGVTTGDSIREEYRGSWVEDRMEGYGVYKYISGAIYRGEWYNNKHEGYGYYEFPDGCLYEGEWKEHKMHGAGVYRDITGRKWKGEFVEGLFQSKMQKKLKYEKMLNKRLQEIENSCSVFFNGFKEAFEGSDKKTLKENLLPYFCGKNNAEEVKVYLKEPYPKYEDKKPDLWMEFFGYIMEDPELNILQKKSASTMLEAGNIRSKQFMGLG